MTEPNSKPLVGNRIVVTGMAGAGKSTFSRVLSSKTGLPVIHLDLYSWGPGWVRVPQYEFLERQRVLLADDRWIVDSTGRSGHGLVDLLMARIQARAAKTSRFSIARRLRRIADATASRRVGNRLAQLAESESRT